MCIAVLMGKHKYEVMEARLMAQFQVKCHSQVGPQAMLTLTVYQKSHFKQTIDKKNSKEGLLLLAIQYKETPPKKRYVHTFRLIKQGPESMHAPFIQ